MGEKLDLNFLKSVQKGLEPAIQPGETALEAIMRTEKEKKDTETVTAALTRMEAERIENLKSRAPQGVFSKPPAGVPNPSAEPPAKEVVFFEGYKLPRDFFTLMGVYLLKSNDATAKRLLEVFGFEMKDLNGKAIVFKKTSPRKPSKKKK